MENEKHRTRLKKAEEDVKFYRQLNQVDHQINEGLNILNEQRAITMENIQESCIVELQRFIDQRGAIHPDTGDIHLPLMSVSQSNAPATIHKIKAANQLIQYIKAAQSIEEIHHVLQNTDLGLGEDIDAIITKCRLMIEMLTPTQNHHSSQKP